MGDIILNNMVFNASAPNVGDRCLLIQNGNTKYAIPLAYIDNSSDSSNTSSMPNESMNFYKCASVDTTNQTWTGYKAILKRSGLYEYESIVTTGLHCSTGYVPEVGKTYSEDAMMEANLWAIPSNSLVFYAPLSSASNTAETGQTIGTIGTVNYGIVDGVPCADSDETKTLYVDEYMYNLDPGIPKTMSVWLNISAWNNNNDGMAITFCTQAGGGTSISFDNQSCRAVRWKGGGSGGTNYNNVSFGKLSLNTWYHLVFTDDGTTMRTYTNGLLVTETTPGGTYRKGIDSINAGITGPGDTVADFVYNLIGYMAAPRIYSRVLSNNEIRVLSKEFTPIK